MPTSIAPNSPDDLRGYGQLVTSDLDLALRMADAADAISMERFGAGDLRVESKPDLTPVSDADLAVETALRDILSAERPEDAVTGEELAEVNPGAARRWVIDPIDGTKNYVRGVPVWATLIALFDGDSPVQGVVSAPALGRRWWAAQGSGAFGSFLGRTRPLSVSGVREIADASLSFSELGEWQGFRREAFAGLLDDCWRTRGYGDFYSYVLVAEGAVDIACEPALSLWDLAALAPIVIAAGGLFTDLDGGPVGPRTNSALATNGVLHESVVSRLRAFDTARSHGDDGRRQ